MLGSLDPVCANHVRSFSGRFLSSVVRCMNWPLNIQRNKVGDHGEGLIHRNSLCHENDSRKRFGFFIFVFVFLSFSF